MADEHRSTTSSLIERLQAEPYRFDFFQAVRRIEGEHLDSPRIGRSRRAKDDPLRFGQKVACNFAPATLSSFVVGEGDQPNRLAVRFFGLTGPNGPMPIDLTEFMYDRQMHVHDFTVGDFFDVFHHRLISLFYRAWASGQPTVSHDRPGPEDRFAVFVASLCGFGMESMLNRDTIPDLAKLHFAGPLANQTRHPEGLTSILKSFFGVNAHINEFCGAWVDLPSDCHCRMGESPETGTLGATTIVGSRIWDCQHRIRIVLGPLAFTDYQRLLPGGGSIRRLIDWVRMYLGDAISWEMQLVLKKGEVPAVQLGKAGSLGWSTWVKEPSVEFEEDADDLVIRPLEP